MNRQVKKYLKIALLFITANILALSFSACALWDDDFIYRQINIKYRILTPEILSEYAATNSMTAAAAVCTAVMPATYEIVCNMTYTFSLPFGQSGRSIQINTATAIMLNEDGYMLTSARAVTATDAQGYPNLKYESRSITVNLVDSDVLFNAELVACNPSNDLAVIKLTDMAKLAARPAYAVFLKHAIDPAQSSVSLFYGEPVVFIGNSMGRGLSVTQGIVSKPVAVSGSLVNSYVQVSLPFSAGDPGGPLCNVWGAVIGIACNNSGNMGFATPSYTILAYLDALNNGSPDNGYIYYSILDINYYYTTVRNFTFGTEQRNK